MSNGKIKIIRSTKNIFDVTKDTLVSRIIELSNSGVLKLDRQQLIKLTEIVKITIDETFQKGVKFHEKEIASVLDELSDQTKKK